LTERVAAACSAALRSGDELEAMRGEVKLLEEALAAQTRRADEAVSRAARAEAALAEAVRGACSTCQFALTCVSDVQSRQRRELNEKLIARLRSAAAPLAELN